MSDTDQGAPRRVRPVILAGGSGTRLWPLSTAQRPKQFLPLLSARTLFQETLDRVADPALFEAPLILCRREHVETVRAQSEGRGARPEILAEAEPRNSGPAIAAAAIWAAASDPEALLLAMPADHAIPDGEAFRAAVQSAADVAAEGWITTFGVRPTRPETGYGYIQFGEALEGDAYRVARFVEKPNTDTALSYLASGDFVWNSGMFLFRACDMIEELNRHRPAMRAGAEEALSAGSAIGAAEDGVWGLDVDGLRVAPAEAIDVAVMEKTDRAAVAPATFAWSDIGAWDAIAERRAEDAPDPRVHLVDAPGSYVRTEGPFVSVIGASNLVVIATGGAVLVARKDQCQAVKSAAAAYAAQMSRNDETG